jgi:hypothetical protein
MTVPPMIRELDPAMLRELACLAERQSPEMRARQRLDAEGREALFDILARGDRPTIGWWSRQFERIDGDASSAS